MFLEEFPQGCKFWGGQGVDWSVNSVDREKLRAVLLINPTKSTLLPILNQGEVGPKKPRQTSCIWFNRQLILLQSSPIKLSSQSLSPKPSEPNSIITLILHS